MNRVDGGEVNRNVPPTNKYKYIDGNCVLCVSCVGYAAKSLQSVTKSGVDSAFTHWRPQGKNRHFYSSFFYSENEKLWKL